MCLLAGERFRLAAGEPAQLGDDACLGIRPGRQRAAMRIRDQLADVQAQPHAAAALPMPCDHSRACAHSRPYVCPTWLGRSAYISAHSACLAFGQSPAGATSNLHAHRVFLVEDNPFIRRSMKEMLEDIAGAQVVAWAEAQEQAVEAMKQTSWTVALVDLLLAKGSGIGVARAFAGRGADRKLYIVTNYATDDMRQRCLEAGADGVFDKSTQLELLLEVLLQPAD